MKDLFPGYYVPSDEEFAELWQQCVFIFDTNVLLDFYEHRKETREDFFKVLEAIKDRLWIPHQVVLEYHENRINRIKQAESNFDDARKILDNEASKILEEKTIKALSHNFKSQHFSSKAVEEMRENVKKVFDTFWDKLASCKEELIQVDGSDYIRDKITDLFQGKIGESPINQAELDEIYLEGLQRYKISRPPGFKDEENKKDNHYIYKGLAFKRAYGDLILWKQILKQVKSKPLSHIIFITSENKEDWWRKEHGKIIGGRPELVEEILEAGASLFYMYKPERFLEYAQKYLQLEVKKESIQQVEEISSSNSLLELEPQDGSFRQLSTIEEDANTLKSYEDNVTEFLTDIDLLNDQTNDRHKKLKKRLAAIIAVSTMIGGNSSIFSPSDFHIDIKSLADKLGIKNFD